MTAYQVALSISKSPKWVKKNFIWPKVWNWGYIKYRLLRPLLKLNYKMFCWLNPERPWTTQASIRIFENILRKDMIGFEYGSGRSTLFFAKRLSKLISVEHDENWYNTVMANLKNRSITNVQYNAIKPNYDKPFNDNSDAAKSLKGSGARLKVEFQDYFNFISRYPDQYFDFIIVDGRARVECTFYSISKLKPGGIFVLDNSDRQRYKPIFDLLDNWKSVTTTTGLFDTTIWFKP